MAIKIYYYYYYLLALLLGFAPKLVQAQQLVVVNGGLFGSSTDFANLGIFNAATGVFSPLDSIYTNSVQDVLIEDNRYIYVAAQDSIVKYDLWLGERIGAAQFGAASTIRLGLYQDKLLVGNWYGASTGNLRIFDKNDLSYSDSIPEITKGATDFLVIGNKAYIAQNNVNGSWSDTLGYIAVVDLDNNSFLHNDTLSVNGAEIGRLVNVGDSALYTINGISNTISSLNLATGTKQTVFAAATLKPKTTGASVFFDGTKWYLPFDNGIGTYNLVNNTVINADIVTVSTAYSFAFAVDVAVGNIYVSTLDFSNQSNNQGLVYNLSGDSTGIFPVGFSPEVLGILNSTVSLSPSFVQGLTIDYQLYPNPCSSILNIRSNSEIRNIYISDLTGRKLIEQQNIENSVTALDITSLPKAVYFITIDKKTTSFIKL